jgi:anti-anti-sigma factor
MSLEPQTSNAFSPSPDYFRCEVQPERSAARVFALGSLDVGTVQVLDAQLRELSEAGFRRLIIDLSRLGFMDSSGLRLLLKWNADARGDGYAIEVVPGPKAVQRVFELTGTSELLRFTAPWPTPLER